MENARNIMKQHAVDVAALGKRPTAASLINLEAQTNIALSTLDTRFSVKYFKDRFNLQRFDPDSAFTVLYDREAMPGFAGGANVEAYQKNGRLYYSQRGEILTADGAEVDLLNPLEALHKQQTHAARIAGWDEFMVKQVNQWATTYGKLNKWLEIPGNPAPWTAGPEELFNKGVFVQNPSGLTRAGINAAENERMFIQRVLSRSTESSQNIYSARASLAKKLASAVGDKKFLPDSIRTGKIVTEVDAVNAMKGAAYDFHFALNPAQFPLQLSNILLATSAHPIHGVAAWKDYMFIQTVLCTIRPA